MSIGSHTSYFVHTLLRARDWQHRPQFDQVCDWWRNGGRGVCALVGMGGAGKTAIADRFLNELLEVGSRSRQTSDESSDVPNSGESSCADLPPPHSVFVYSFYDDDKPENFFRHRPIWLEGTSAPDQQKSPTQLMFDIQQHQGLIILDGLEKVQESGARSGFGRLTSPSLRDLLNHIASGSARELSVLVTSRFPLTDLRDSQPRFFHTIAVDQIGVSAGITLLRSRGVRGSDVQLAPVVEHCGGHALTIDLAGGYIKEYGHGDPSTPLNLGTAEELQAEAEQESDDNKRAVLKQGIRFARIAQRYREKLAVDTYANRLGGFDNLGLHLAHYERGLQITQQILDAIDDSDETWVFPDHDHVQLMQDRALLLASTGRLAAAEAQFGRAAGICCDDQLSLSRGRLMIARGRIQPAIKLFSDGTPQTHAYTGESGDYL